MLTLDDAKRIIAAAEKAASEDVKQPMNIAVVDAGGHLLAFVRQPDAWLGSIDIAINKAFTARALDISTKELSELSQPEEQFFGIHASNHSRVVIFAGCIPLKRNSGHRRGGCQRRLLDAGSGRGRGRNGSTLMLFSLSGARVSAGSDASVDRERGDEVMLPELRRVASVDCRDCRAKGLQHAANVRLDLLRYRSSRTGLLGLGLVQTREWKPLKAAQGLQRPDPGQ